MTKRLPHVPHVTVFLGRAVELDGTDWKWTWNKRDDFIVVCSHTGKKLYIFKRPKIVTARNPESKQMKKGTRLYGAFNRRVVDKTWQGRVKSPSKKAGRAINIVYHSDKFGDAADYIHTFDTYPIIWVDNPKKPSVIALTGGNINVTKRGIVG